MMRYGMETLWNCMNTTHSLGRSSAYFNSTDLSSAEWGRSCKILNPWGVKLFLLYCLAFLLCYRAVFPLSNGILHVYGKIERFKRYFGSNVVSQSRFFLAFWLKKRLKISIKCLRMVKMTYNLYTICIIIIFINFDKNLIFWDFTSILLSNFWRKTYQGLGIYSNWPNF